MAIVAGSLIFRPTRVCALGAPVADAWHVPAANCDRCTPRTCGLPIEPQERVRFQRRPERARAFFILNDRSSASEVHAAHSAHASTGTARHRWALLLRHLCNHGLGCDEQAR